MQMILTHNGIRVQASSEQECQAAQLPDLLMVSTPYGHFEIKREHAETVARLVGLAHDITRNKEATAAPDNVLPMPRMFLKQAD